MNKDNCNKEFIEIFNEHGENAFSFKDKIEHEYHLTLHINLKKDMMIELINWANVNQISVGKPEEKILSKVSKFLKISFTKLEEWFK